MTWKSLFNSIFCLALLNVCLSKTPRDSRESGRHKCPHPVLKRHGTDMAIDVVGYLRGIGEVKFNGAIGNMESKRYCKIKCINGEWVGPLCLVEGDTETSGDGRFHPVFKSCSSQIFHSKFVLSYQNKTIFDTREFSHGSVVQVRCKRFGVFKLIGDAHLTCHNGVWKHRIPTCIPTSSLTNFTDESAPPSVLAKVTSGSVSIEPTGELAVYPGSTVHLECLYLRSSGEPQWTWTSTFRTYTTGWSIDAEERDWKYRLSIYYVKPQDTGIYTCSTPKGLTHSIILNVIEVHCDIEKILTNDPNLLTQIQGSRLGQSTTYQCREGFKLNGTSVVTCQASGVWSGYAPQCVPIVCPELKVENTSVKLTKQDFGYGGTATFQCPFGHKLIGVGTLVCLITGEWSGKVPTCKEVFCTPPLTPQNAKLELGNQSNGSPPFQVGSELTFSCKGHFKMIGKSVIKCQDSGVWSNPPPLCKALCLHPGDPPRGRFTPRKPEYEPGDRISLSCSNGYETTKKVKPKCQKNGSWSDVGLECRLKDTYKFSERKTSELSIYTPKATTSVTPISSSQTPSISNSTNTNLVPILLQVTSTPDNTKTHTTPAVTLNSHTPTTKINKNSLQQFNLTVNEENKNETDFFYVIEEQFH